MPNKDKTKMGRLSKLLIILITAFFLPFGYVNAQSTPSATLYLTPDSAPISEGSKFSLDIRENSGNFKVNAVDIRLTYPNEKLDLNTDDIKISSPFSLIQKSTSGSSIRIIAATLSEPRYVFGDQSIATLTFTAKEDTDASKTTVNQPSSAVASCGKNILKVQGDPGCAYVPPAPTNPEPTQPDQQAPASSSASRPATRTPLATATPVKEGKVALSVTTPNTEWRKEQNQVGFWVPMLVLAGTLLISTMAASGFSAGGIFKHFKFLRPVNRLKRYPHL